VIERLVRIERCEIHDIICIKQLQKVRAADGRNTLSSASRGSLFTPESGGVAIIRLWLRKCTDSEMKHDAQKIGAIQHANLFKLTTDFSFILPQCTDSEMRRNMTQKIGTLQHTNLFKLTTKFCLYTAVY